MKKWAMKYEGLLGQIFRSEPSQRFIEAGFIPSAPESVCRRTAVRYGVQLYYTVKVALQCTPAYRRVLGRNKLPNWFQHRAKIPKY